MFRLQGEAAQVWDSTNGFHKDRDRPPWELKVPDPKIEPHVKSLTLDGMIDYLVKEKQSQILYGDMTAPVAVKSRDVAPPQIWDGGTYQAGNPLIEKLERLRDRKGLDALQDNCELEANGRRGNLILSRAQLF